MSIRETVTTEDGVVSMRKWASLSREQALDRGLVLCGGCPERFEARAVVNLRKCPNCKARLIRKTDSGRP